MRTISGGILVDRAAFQRGTQAPFDRWEGDSTGLWGVLTCARSFGLTLDRDTEEIAGLIFRSRWLAAARAQGPLAHSLCPAMTGQPVDADTQHKGVTGPFEPGEADQAALVRVLREAARLGLTLTKNTDPLATLIMRSRWRWAALSLPADQSQVASVAPGMVG